MTDCGNVEIQDRLPEFVAGTLTASDAAEVRAHLASCPACAADVELLRVVRGLAPSVPALDVAAIVASLPKPGAGVEAAAPRLRVIPGGRSASPGREHTETRSSMAARRTWFSAWRMAAAIGVIAVGSLSAVIARSGSLSLLGTTRGPLSDSTPGTATAIIAAVDSPATPVEPPVESASGPNGVAVSYGDLGDYTAEELEQMLARLEQWDGAASADPLPGVPLLPPASGSDGGDDGSAP